MQSWRRRGLGALLVVPLGVACGSSGASSGAGGSDQESCDKYVSAGCGSASACMRTLGEWRADSAALGCGDLGSEAAACTATHGWHCESAGQVSVIEPAPPCDTTAFNACLQGCWSSYGSGGCQVSCDTAQKLAMSCASKAGGPCQCTEGPKAGASFTASVCGIAALVDNCGS